MAGCDRAEELRGAANHGNAATVRQLAHDHPTWVNSADEYGDSPLNLAVERGDPEIVEILLKAGADPNHESYRTFAPLDYVACYGGVNVAKLLIEAGANVNLVSKYGGGTLALHDAAVRGDPGMVDYLIAKGADVNLRSKKGVTPLLSAANSQILDKEGGLKVFELLIAHGADVNAVADDGHSVLYYAKNRGIDEKIIEFLIQKGAKDL